MSNIKIKVEIRAELSASINVDLGEGQKRGYTATGSIFIAEAELNNPKKLHQRIDKIKERLKKKIEEEMK